MNESDKKRLTKWLGEEWEDFKVTEWPYYTLEGGREYSMFPIEGVEPVVRFVPQKRRTFTEDADFFACFNRLVELGEWEDFSMYASKKWVKRHWANPDIRAVTARFTEWLNSRTESGLYRLCVLVAEWLAQKEGTPK
jgi:hypothetical protein